MYTTISGVCILIIFSGISMADTNYPSDLSKCRIGDNKCITEAVQLFAKNYTDGIPSINLPSMEPLLVGRIDVIREKKIGNLKILALEHINWKNVNVNLYGLKNATFTINGFEKNLNNSNIIITMFIPNATYTAEYDLNLKFLQRQINDQGKLRFVSENLKIIWSFKLKLYEKDDGKQYVTIDQPQLDYTFTESCSIIFRTPCDGNGLLSRFDHIFLNQNCKLLLDNVKSAVEPEYARAFADIVEPIFSKFSIDEMFLIDE